jgi:hypothetical protein
MREFLTMWSFDTKMNPPAHKLLDLVGDLALAGRPIRGQILAARPGHAANVAFAKKLKKVMLEQEKKSLPKGITDLRPKCTTAFGRSSDIQNAASPLSFFV